MKKTLYSIALALILSACAKTEQPGDSVLVVEGWIENGARPVVMVSESIGISSERPQARRHSWA